VRAFPTYESSSDCNTAASQLIASTVSVSKWGDCSRNSARTGYVLASVRVMRCKVVVEVVPGGVYWRVRSRQCTSPLSPARSGMPKIQW
jgi:hypothetical protein